AASRASDDDAKRLRALGRKISKGALDVRREAALSDALDALMRRYPSRVHDTNFAQVLTVVVDPPRARFSAWYELFPRSVRGDGTHGTLADVEAALPQIAELGFNVLYLPPIHPIGATKCKGPNNTLVAGPQDPGSPWAIGARDGGHKSVHAELGTVADLARLVEAARALGIEIALDIAFQCSPDHPYVKEHPQWFRRRPDGSVQYAENPPKKYEDIYPFDFETDDWLALWSELESVFRFWMEQGVYVFRVDNPHTKPFAMWEGIITRLKAEHPQLIFLSEAFTRPKVMHRLAKLGFTQSYTYFAWRNSKAELIEYFTELAHDPSREYFRPNVWPNTPDILTEALQHGGRATFISRLVLAATLSANYGVYGPAYELMEHLPRSPGSEEYLHSEKYEIRRWLLDAPGNLRPLMSQLNRIRRENSALQSDWSLRFVDTDNDLLIAYSKISADGDNALLIVVNLDQRWTQSGWVTVDLAEYALEPDARFIVHDLLDGARYEWQGARNYVALDPAKMPAHIFRIEHISPLPDPDAGLD
ncbi:MAG: alpha-1,4-glucan--maltose-1-phosphate maltosyltransferase, partial [Burkholderiaceae bacterium]